MNKIKKKIGITTGDPNGIGAEIVLKAIEKLELRKDDFVLISNEKILNFYSLKPKDLDIITVNYKEKDIIPGKTTKESGDFSFRCLEKACELAKNGIIKAIVTAPVSKEAMHLAGHLFNGQTEVLQHFLAHENQHAEMLFTARDFRVLLLTRHIALKDISLNKQDLFNKIYDTNTFFKDKFGFKKPKFALCALNPHAGEGGILGNEENEILKPLLKDLKEKGIDITEPLPADTLFIEGAQAYLNNKKVPFDCYLACYHDQGLIPIKTVAAEKTVNMTIGLDVIRTSPCHGTAFDIAGKNIASAESMIEAIKQVL